MSVAFKMTMRGVLKRGTGTDGYKGPANAEPLAVNTDCHCYVFVKNVNHIETGGRVLAVEEITGIFRASEDVQAGDQLSNICDRNGVGLIDGTLYIHAVSQRTRGAIVTHQSAVLRRTR